MKKALIIVLALAVLAVALTGASKWPAKLTIRNDTDTTAYFNFEGDEYPIVQLTVGAGEKKVYDMPRGVWDGKLTVCGVTKKFTINVRHNVWLAIPTCEKMKQLPPQVAMNEDQVAPEHKAKESWFPMWLGEPSMEKINMNLGSRLWAGGQKYYMLEVPERWKFQY